MDRDKRLVLAILVVIGIGVYLAGIAVRTAAERTRLLIPTVAILPTEAPTFTPSPSFTPMPTEAPTATIPPTEIPTEVPPTVTEAPPTAIPTDSPPTHMAADSAISLPTDVLQQTAAALALTDIAYATSAFKTAVAQVTPFATTMTGAIISTPKVTPPEPPPAPTLTPTPPLPTPVEITAVVKADRGLILRSGPGKEYPSLAVLLRGAVVEIISRTEDNVWVSVRTGDKSGWMSTEFLAFSAALDFVPVEGEAVIAAIPTARSCISVVGDSLAYGEVIFELPGVGFIKVKMAPFSTFVEDQLRQINISDYTVYDRSYPGTGISSPKHKSFYDTPAWSSLLKDRCVYTLVLPWVNDMSSGLDPAYSAQEHALRLTEFAQRLLKNNPDGKIIFGNYYPGAPAEFSKAMAWGFTPQAIELFNQSMKNACTLGELSKMPQVLCVDVNPAFTSVADKYVVGRMPRSEVDALTTRPLTGEEQNMLNYYSSANPGALLNGDGIHLSSLGKRLLAYYLVEKAFNMTAP